MNIKKIVPSFNKKTNTDCFENKGHPEIDHIYPTSYSGSDINLNRIHLTRQSNSEKANKTKGKIGKKWRFCVIKKTTRDGFIYGTMYIRRKDWENDVWHEIKPAK